MKRTKSIVTGVRRAVHDATQYRVFAPRKGVRGSHRKAVADHIRKLRSKKKTRKRLQSSVRLHRMNIEEGYY